MSNGAYMCGRMFFNDDLPPASINAFAKSSLIETVLFFTERFGELYPERTFQKLELFLDEGQMRRREKPFQTTHFTQ